MNPDRRQPLLDGSIAAFAVLAPALASCCFSLVHLDFPALDPLASLGHAMFAFLGGAAALLLGAALWLFRWLRHRRVGAASGALLLLAAALLAMCAWLAPMQLLSR